MRERHRSIRLRAAAGGLVLLLLGVGATVAGTTAAAGAVPTAGARSGVVTLAATSGKISGTVHFGITPTAGAGEQVCDPANSSYAVVYAATPGDEYGIAGESVNYTILAPSDGSMVPAGGTLKQYLPTVLDPLFPAEGGNSPLDSTTNGVFSFGVRCQDETSTNIFQNYWTTVTIKDGRWTVGGSGPTTSPTTGSTSSSGSTGSTTASATTTSPPTRRQSGVLTASPSGGSLLGGSYRLAAVPGSGSGAQPCGSEQAFAVLYFAPVGDEFQPQDSATSIIKARPLQAAGLDIPVGGGLVSFLTSVGAVDFSQSLGATEGWRRSLPAGRYSLGVRCQSGTASDPTVYQNYWTAVDVTAGGNWQVAGAPGTTTPTTTATTTATPGGHVTVALLDAGGRAVPSPVTVTQGQRLFLSASGFEPSESVTVIVRSAPVTLATTTAVNGGIAAEIVIPVDLPTGAHVLTVTGSRSGRTKAIGITVKAVSAATTTTPTSRSITTTTTTADTTPVSTGPTLTTSTVSTSTSYSTTVSTMTTSNAVLPQGGLTPGPTWTPFVTPSTAAGQPVGGTGVQQGLAYTGFPVNDALDAALLLVGFGLVILVLTSGAGSSAKLQPVGDARRGQAPGRPVQAP